MPLTLPNLDDRRWAELVAEGRALLPFYAPQWTDHNVHDPGITLMELLAWMAEMDLYQLNRIPARHRQKFLSLVGVQPAPPRPALTVLQVTATERVNLPVTVEVTATTPAGQALPFRTRESLRAAAITLQAVQYGDATGLHDLTGRWQRGESLPLFGLDPQPGAMLYLGLAQAPPVNQWLSLYFIVRDLEQSEAERQRLETLTPIRPLPHHAVQTVWEYVDRAGQWQALAEKAVLDQTRAFTLNGAVTLKPGAALGKQQIGQREEQFYLRCRFVSGAYEAPPQAQALLTNGVLAEQSATVGTRQTIRTKTGAQRLDATSLGQSTGLPHQQLTLAHPPVVADSFRLFTTENGKGREWTLRPDFTASGRGDAHFVLDAVQGLVRFGDGEHGRIPPAAATIWASYRLTDAAQGNLATKTAMQVSFSDHNKMLRGFDPAATRTKTSGITNVIPARGGREAETIEQAEGRAFALVTTQERAVTLNDYETLARQTPGVAIARVTARADLHPAFPCLKAPGLVTVVVLPFLPQQRPLPSRALLQQVAAHLQPRRVIGTRVEVVAPRYVEVAVRAQVQSLAGTSRADVSRRIIAALNAFLHPLTGGPDGDGWPFGRDVYRAEIMQVIDEVRGVDHVLSLSLLLADGSAHCGNLCLRALELVAAGAHEIEVR
jgi:predicted phage baseplate assembly protein